MKKMSKIDLNATASDETFKVKSKKAKKTKKQKIVKEESSYEIGSGFSEDYYEDNYDDLSSYRSVYTSMNDW